jgi:hypothetical protein
MTLDQLPAWYSVMILVIVLWSLPWKAVALWKAARNNDLVWFILLMIINTVGILEILYIYIFGKKRQKNN